ncbi:hypothetical protein CTA1_13012 [Colletotrichum tanaceti]|uniref:DUF6536 domain-containing protein n=1 Tax=Colletotrichum tanaceti TaxID=1306861 RepID=A0A4U6X8L8_9PEZI|nr:hypothetical protein CTA1_13012 [Colletotrichum tanaceti]
MRPTSQPEPGPDVAISARTSTNTPTHNGADTVRASEGPTKSTTSFRVHGFADKDTLSGWFPQIKNDENNSWRIWLSRRSRALMVQLGVIGLILITNLGLTIFAVASYGSEKGVGLIYHGDCSTVKRLDQWIHLLINLLGTGMLSASNYCMQLQAAPTRENVDAAHKAGKWLDIGIPSLRNLRYLSNWRRASWALLAISSIPIHLIYNSAVFKSLSSHNYTVAVVKDSFVRNSSWSLSTAEANRAGDWGWDDTRVNPPNLDYEEILRGMQRDAQTYREMNISACFALYDDYWKPQGNVLVFVKNETLQTPPEDSLLMYVSIVPRSDNWGKNMWALGNGTGRFVAQSPLGDVTKWFLGPQQYEVDRCLVQPPESMRTRCRFEYSPPIMFTICVMNFLKASIMLCIWVLRKWQNREQKDKANQVLHTLGDAIASFTREPCEHTRDLGLGTKYDFLTTREWKNRLVRSPPAVLAEETHEARTYKIEVKHWRSAASLKRWVILLAMCLLVLLVAAVLLVISFTSLRHRRFGVGIPELWRLGFGALTPFTYLVINLPRRDPGGLIANVLLANLPQLVLSVLYILYNTMLSTFLVQREFGRMHDPERRKALRVSEPVGIQRSSYFISLPLRYGIPLYASSGLMHWLISQSLFLARIRAVSAEGADDEANSFSTCGYSPIATFTTILAGLVMVCVILAIGFVRRYDGKMRMVSTNSLAISASCHVLEEDRASGYLLPLQWGVVQMSAGEGKCAFTTAATDTVKLPTEGLRYK